MCASGQAVVSVQHQTARVDRTTESSLLMIQRSTGLIEVLEGEGGMRGTSDDRTYRNCGSREWSAGPAFPAHCTTTRRQEVGNESLKM